ncbi:MAG: outer membrane beta-barrel protein [Gemmatimonadota bacterium]
MSRRPLVAAAFLLTSLFSASSANAQSKLEFSPFVGAYMPTRPLVADTTGATEIFETKSDVVFGVRLGYWLSGRFGLEGSLALSPTETSLLVAGSTTQTIKFRASAFMADLRGRFDVTNPSAPTRLHLNAGLAYTRSSNAFFDLAHEIGQLKFKTSLGGVIGAGVSRRIGNGVDLRLDIEDRIYKTDFESPTSTVNLKSRTQHDFIFATGLGFHL